MGGVKRWSYREIRLVRRLARSCTAAQIAGVLGRTPAAVRQKAMLEKITLQKSGDADYRTKYSDAVVEVSRQLHEQGTPPMEIARLLGVPIGSVKSFVYYRGRLGLPPKQRAAA